MAASDWIKSVNRRLHLFISKDYIQFESMKDIIDSDLEDPDINTSTSFPIGNISQQIDVNSI
jgi:hypothetical protein